MDEPLYHTALPGHNLTDAPPREWFALGDSIAFQHDVNDGFPREALEADILYADLPWRDGYEEFLHRAVAASGQTDVVDRAKAYERWLYQLNCQLAAFGKPWIVVGGYASVRFLGCEWVRPVRLNGSQAMAMGARCHRPPEDVADADGLLRWLAGDPQFNRVYDFCCGYGRSARIFHEAGKSFVATDFNPDCIGHIAQEAPKWLSATT